MKTLLLSFVLVVAALPASAQESNPLAWPAEHRKLAARISDATVITSIAVDSIHSFRSTDKGRAFACQSYRVAASMIVAELLKRAIHRMRPDGSDNKSFPSMHTAIATSSFAWNVRIQIPVGAGTGLLRQGANKHYPTDTAAGFGIGFVAGQLFCE